MTRQDAQSPYRLGEIGRLSQTGSMSTQACSAVSALAACWRGISALALCCLELACAGAPPPASASSPAPVAGEEPQQLTLYPGTPEYRAFLEQIHQDIVLSRAEIEPILEDGDIAQLTIAGSQRSVERIEQSRARRIAMILERDYPKDEVGPRWFRRSQGTGRIFVMMGEGTLLFNIDDTGISLEPGSLGED